MPVSALFKLSNYTHNERTAFSLVAIAFICLAGGIGTGIYGLIHGSDSPDAKNYRTAMSIILLVVSVALVWIAGYVLK